MNAHGHGPHKMESAEDSLPATPTEIAYSCPPLAAGTLPTSTMRGPSAATGLLPSVRTTRTSRGTWASIRPMSTGTATTAASGSLFVPFQNKDSQGRKPSESAAWFAQHERTLTGASPQTALIVGRLQPKARVSIVMWNLKEACGKQLARCTRTWYKAGRCGQCCQRSISPITIRNINGKPSGYKLERVRP